MHPIEENRLRRMLGVFLSVSYIYVVTVNIVAILRGGDGWSQGDWLINSDDVEVRRSVFGDLFLLLHDALSLDILFSVAVAQTALLSLLFYGFYRLLTGLRDVRTMALLAFAPGLFTVFWVVDVDGAMRKELVAFAALTVAALGVVERRRELFVAGAGLLSLGFLGHEGMTLFLPTLSGLALLSWLAGERNAAIWVSVGCATLAAVFSLVYAAHHAVIADIRDVCDPLLDRGLDRDICEGSIEWLGRGLDFGRAEVARRLTPSSAAVFALSYAAVLGAQVYLFSRTDRPYVSCLLAFAAVAPFLPLYPVAVDWGRWMSFHVMSVSVLTATALRLGLLQVRRPPAMKELVLLLLLAIALSPEHNLPKLH